MDVMGEGMGEEATLGAEAPIEGGVVGDGGIGRRDVALDPALFGL